MLANFIRFTYTRDMKNTLRSYNIVLTSAKVAFEGGAVNGRPVVWDGSWTYPSGRKAAFIGEVVSLWEDHTPDSVTTRAAALAIEHGIPVSEVLVVLR